MKMKCKINVVLTEDDIRNTLVEYISSKNQAISGLKPEHISFDIKENIFAMESSAVSKYRISAFIDCEVDVEIGTERREGYENRKL